jgi:outer membrane protein TolC
MLRITTHEEETTLRIEFEGRLTGAWAIEAGQEWRRANAAGRRLEVDLRSVIAIDDEGWRLLNAMKASGATFLTEGVGMNQLIEEMTSGRSPARSHGRCRLLTLLVIAVLGASAGVARAQAPLQPMRLTLQEAVNLALKQNPDVAIAALNFVQRESAGDAARSALLPQISAGASDYVTRANVESLFGEPVPGFAQHIGPFWTVQAGMRFSAPVFDLSLWRHWQASRESIKTSGAERDSARELNAQLVVSQYLGGLRAAADVAAAKSRLDLAEALFTLAGDLERNGVGTRLDTLRAQVEFQNERQRHAAAQAQLKLSRYGLVQLLNLDPRQPIELVDEPQFFQTPAFDRDQSIASALAQRPELRAVEARTRAAELERQSARAQLAPRVSVSGGWRLEGLTDSSKIPVYQYAASVDVPVFTGGRIKAQTAIAALDVKKLSEAAQATRNQIAQEVQSATALLDAARVEVDAANLGVTLAREAVTQAEDRFRAGVANNIEVISAQDQLARANDNQIAALYHYNQGRADLARATGQMETIYAK